MPTPARLGVLIAGSSLAGIGYGMVLPFLYADVAEARGFGGAAASGVFVCFAVGSLLAAPLAGRLADLHDPAVVSGGARLLVAVALLGLAFAPSMAWLWVAAALYGAAGAATWPSIQVLVLAWVSEHRLREAFAWQFISVNIAIAVGGGTGGFLVDLSSATGTRPIFYLGAAAEMASAAIVWIVARHGRVSRDEVAGPPPTGALRSVLASPALRLLVAVEFVLALIFYAQYEAGLPAYAHRSLDVSPHWVGIAIAVNAVFVAAITGPVVAATRRRDPLLLLRLCVATWAACWAMLGLPLLGVGGAVHLLILSYALFAVGEAMFSPVITPLAAGLAAPGTTGRALAAVSAAQTLAGALGPGISGLLFLLDAPAAFIAFQLCCCLATVGLLRRLQRHLTPGRATPGGTVSRSPVSRDSCASPGRAPS